MRRLRGRGATGRSVTCARGRFRCLAALALGPAVLAGCALAPGPVQRPSTPIADRPIHLSAQCAQTEEDGFREQATLSVRDNVVEALSWRLWVGKRGGCSFDLAGFRQTRLRPHIELRERDGGACRLMVWQAPERITLAHAGCERHCAPGIYEQAMPVMFDPATGGCARP